MSLTDACKRVCVYLWSLAAVFDLAGVEALLIRVLQACEYSGATEAHRIDRSLIVKQSPVCDDLP